MARDPVHAWLLRLCDPQDYADLTAPLGQARSFS
jgi:hypothetical protein